MENKGGIGRTRKNKGGIGRTRKNKGGKLPFHH